MAGFPVVRRSSVLPDKVHGIEKSKRNPGRKETHARGSIAHVVLK